ncbi:MAG: glycosyltransferase family 2 protein [Chloroflexi bacterium]|nr:glycosyltransferase family 2 protein [Chloroflexota bacterium]
MTRPFLSVIIPAYNEESRIGDALDKIVDYLAAQDYTWEIIVADDGSTDSTAALVEACCLKEGRIRLECLSHGGKGWAVKNGMLAASGDYRFMCDADVATPIEYLSSFLEKLSEGYDIVIGSRQIEGARRFNESALRHGLGRLFNWSVRLIAVRDFQDTQCGFKCMRGDVAERIFRLQQTKGWGFDVELLYLALKMNMRVFELPVDWYHDPSSKLRVGIDSLLMIRDTLLVRVRDLFGKYRLDGRSCEGSSRALAERSGDHK